MAEHSFEWERSSQLSIPQVLLAISGPSAIAFAGFHGVLPRLVASGMPVLVAWPLVASVMLGGFVVFAIILLRGDARRMGVSLYARFCLRRPTGREWLISLAVFVLAIALTAAGAAIVPPMLRAIGYEIPSYMPFFLNPAINPMEAEMEVISPGLPLAGEYGLIPLILLTLTLNVLTEDLYFRAWMLPKMARYGTAGWVANGVLFASYHTFQLWLFPALLGVTLCMAFLVYKTRSIWPSFALHMLINGLNLVGIVALIAG